MPTDQVPPRTLWCLLAAGLALVYIRGLFLDVMDVDASQYAAMAMELLHSGHWLQIQHQHAAYLDKPPLLFWTAAAAFRLFGLHNWSYKLPSACAVAIGVWALYQLTARHYGRVVARNAVIILATSVGLVMALNDVRTDAMLMGWTIAAVWQADRYIAFAAERQRWLALLLAGVFAGLAMMTKGPIGIVMPAFAIGAHLALRRDWRTLGRWEWLLLPVMALLVLLPMCWGLYQQFDLHPLLTVNGRTGVSGLRFFFWDQSFGRITGSNAWKNDTSPFFFVHTYLWVFLPWSLLFVAALWRRLGELLGNRFSIPHTDEGYSIGGFLLTFLALSLSHYKLPHYIFITLPWAALLTARWLGQRPVTASWWRGQYVVFLLLAMLSFWMLTLGFPTSDPIRWIGIAGGFILVAVLSWRSALPIDGNRAALITALAGTTTAFMLNFHFYPVSLRFQGTTAIARMARQADIPASEMATFHTHGDAMAFYSGRVLPVLENVDAVDQAAIAQHTLYLLADTAQRAELDRAMVPYAVALTAHHFEVAQPTIPFLRAATRPSKLRPLYLLRLERNPAER
ncbi:MAG TPA: glycosyltransferase family 39 protein [Gemmatimonadales bacterium]|jgi:4-amino-4-deoxy-L-arabinose transferase-like glycosyltransferase